VKIGNAIDQLRYSGGFWKEQRRRYLEKLLRRSSNLKKEWEQMEEFDIEEIEGPKEHC
jgi:hypothetical protein